jgi:hypothetical protein
VSGQPHALVALSREKNTLYPLNNRLVFDAHYYYYYYYTPTNLSLLKFCLLSRNAYSINMKKHLAMEAGRKL